MDRRRERQNGVTLRKLDWKSREISWAADVGSPTDQGRQIPEGSDLGDEKKEIGPRLSRGVSFSSLTTDAIVWTETLYVKT